MALLSQADDDDDFAVFLDPGLNQKTKKLQSSAQEVPFGKD